MPFLFQHLVNSTLINSVNRCDLVLVLTSPMPKPNIHSVIKRKSAHSDFPKSGSSLN